MASLRVCDGNRIESLNIRWEEWQIALFRLIPPYSTALFRLIRFILKLWRCTQKPNGSSTVSAGIDQPKPFQMEQIVPQSTVGNR